MHVRTRRLATLAAAALLGATAPWILSSGALDWAHDGDHDGARASRAGSAFLVYAAEDGDAEETVPPAERYEKQRPEAFEKAADLFAEVASFGMRKKLKRTAVETYERALEYFPDHDKARKELGFKKEKGEWVEDEKKSSKIRRLRDENDKGRRDFEKKLTEAEAEAGGLFATLGDVAAAARSGFAESDDDWHEWNKKAIRHWKQALELDSQNESANKGVGNRLLEGMWVSDASLRHKEFMKRYQAALDTARKLEVAVVETDDTTGYAQAVRIPVLVYKTKNFRIESNLDAASIRETLIWLERGRRFFIDLYGIPEHLLDYSASPPTQIIVRNRKEYDSIVDTCPTIENERRSFLKKFGACPLDDRTGLLIAENSEVAQRETIHIKTHTMTRDVFGNHAPWLFEALANSISTALKSADLKVCFSGNGSTGGIHLERMSLDQAPGILREKVRTKKDPPIAGFVPLPSDGMNALQIAKSWSVLMYLLERDQGQCREYLSRAGQGNEGKNSKDARVLKAFYPEFPTWTDLDQEWRDWAVDVYRDR